MYLNFKMMRNTDVTVDVWLCRRFWSLSNNSWRD
jgi:hypothetical protein